MIRMPSIRICAAHDIKKKMNNPPGSEAADRFGLLLFYLAVRRSKWVWEIR